MPVFEPKVPDLILPYDTSGQQPDFRYTSEFQKGLFRGGKQTKAAFAEAGALAANMLSAEGVAQELVDTATRSLRQAQVAPPAVQNVRDVNSVGSAFDFAAGALGETIPFMAGALIGRGLGARAGRNLGKVGKTIATEGGTFAGVAVPETGLSSRELREETGQYQPGLSLGAGAAKGALDTFSIGKAIRPLTGGVPKDSILRELRNSAIREGITEGLQEGVDIGAVRYAKGQDLLAPLSMEEFDRLLNATAAGAVAGGTLSGAAMSARAGLDRLKDVGESAPKPRSALEYIDLIKQTKTPEEVQNIAASMGYSSIDEMEQDLRTLSEISPDQGQAFFYDDQTQMPFVPPELWQEAGVSNAYSGIDRRIEKLIQEDPGIQATVANMRAQGKSEEQIQQYIEQANPYFKESYYDYVAKQAEDNGIDPRQAAQAAAQQIVQRFPKLTPILRRRGAVQFLKDIQYIRKDPLASVQIDELSLSSKELFGQGKDARERFSSAILRKPGKNNSVRKGEVQIRLKDKDGKWRTYSVNLQRLANTMMRKIQASAGMPLADRVGQAVMAGLASIADLPNVSDVDFSFLDKLSTEDKARISVYQQKRGEGQPTRQLTLLDVERKGLGRFAARKVSAQARYLEAKAELNRLVKQGQKLRGIVEQMALETDIAELQKLRDRYIKLRRQLPTLEQDVADAQRALEVARVRMAEEEKAAREKEAFAEEKSLSNEPDVTGKEGEIEGIKKQPIERGYSKGDNPYAESLYNFHTNEDRFERHVSEGDVRSAYEEAANYYQSLMDAYTMFYRIDKNDRTALEDLFIWVNFKEGQEFDRKDFPKSTELLRRMTKTALDRKLEYARNRMREAFENQRAEGAEAIKEIDGQKSVKNSQSMGFHNMISKTDEEWKQTREFKLLQTLYQRLDERLNGLLSKNGIELITPIKFASLVDPQRVERYAGAAMTTNAGNQYIYVDPYLSPTALANTLVHEVGHAVKNTLYDSASKEVKRAVVREYGKFLQETEDYSSDDAAVVVEALQKLFEDRFYSAYSTRVYMEGRAEPDDEHLEYLRGFDEWFADKAAARLLDPNPPKTAFEKFLQKLVDWLAKIFKVHVEDLNESTVAEFVEANLDPQKERDSSRTMSVDLVLDAWRENGRAEVVDPGSSDPMTLLASGKISKFLKRVLGTDLDVSSATKIAQNLATVNRGDPYGAAAHESIKQAAQTLLTEKERAILLRATNSPYVKRQVMKLLREFPDAAAKAQEDPETMMGFAYQFWLAGEIDLGNKTKSTFNKLHRIAAEVLGLARNDENAEILFKQFTSGEAYLKSAETSSTYEPRFVVKEVVKNTIIQKAVHNALVPAWKKTLGSGVWKALFTAAATRLRDTDNPYLKQIADRIDAKDVPFAGEDMLSARTRWIGRFTNVAYHIFEGDYESTQEFGQRVVKMLNTKVVDPDPRVRKAAIKVKKLLNEIFIHARESGLSIGFIEDYFPWVFDLTKLVNNADKFVELMSEENIAQAMKANLGESVTPQSLLYSLLDSNGYADINTEFDGVSRVPSMSAINERTLRFLDEVMTEEQRARFGEFFSDNIGQTLTTYIEQAVKRSEYQRRFGNGKFEELLDKAKQYGATDEEIEMAETTMDAVMGVHGWETNVKLRKLLRLPEPPPGEVINPKLQKTMGAIMVYQNLRLLSLATLTSLVDPIGIAVRTGDLGIAFQSFLRGIKEAYQEAINEPTVLTDMAEGLGVVDRHMTLQALNWEYGGVFMTGWPRKINEAFFKGIGLQAWTKSTRLMATDAALRFIRRHIKVPNQNSERYLAELDLFPEDVKFNDQGEVLILTKVERQRLREAARQGDEAAAQELARDDKVRTAVHKFVDGAILRPNAAIRPVWASDPHFMLVFHLKSFTWAFYERITKRVLREAAQANLMPLMAYGLFIPFMLGAEWLRDVIQHGGEGDPIKENWDMMDHIGYAANRAGLLGLGTLAQDATMDIKYGGLGYESFSGPTLEQIDEILIKQNPRWEKYIPLESAF